MNYTKIGNVLQVVNLLNIFAYGVVCYRFSHLLDPSWLQHGFCVTDNEETLPYHTTHDVSGYIMVLISLLGLGMIQMASSSNAPPSTADRLVYHALLGALGHGMGHFLIAHGTRHHYYPDADEVFVDDLRQSDSYVQMAVKVLPGYPLFWIPLVKTYMLNTAGNYVALSAAIIQLVGLYVPVKFGFGYTQSVLFAGLSLDQLFAVSYKQELEYALWPALTVLPSGLLGWLEATQCSKSALFQTYGHTLYDTFMVSSFLLFYTICHFVRRRDSKEKGD